MKIKHLVELLLRFDQEVEVWTDRYQGSHSDHSHGFVRVREDIIHGERVVRIGRFTSSDRSDRDFYRTTITNGDDGIKSYIQTYEHLRAETEDDAAGDLAAGAITPAQYQEDLSRIALKNAMQQRRQDEAELNEYKRLRSKFGVYQFKISDV